MSDEAWAFFAPFVIETGPRRGRRPRDHRLVLDGVFWIARTGSAWRDLHDHFGKWSSVYRQFRRWTLSGVWDVLLATRYDKTADSYLGFILVASIRLWVRHFVNMT
jgi:transposase